MFTRRREREVGERNRDTLKIHIFNNLLLGSWFGQIRDQQISCGLILLYNT